MGGPVAALRTAFGGQPTEVQAREQVTARLLEQVGQRAFLDFLHRNPEFRTALAGYLQENAGFIGGEARVARSVINKLTLPQSRNPVFTADEMIAIIRAVSDRADLEKQALFGGFFASQVGERARTQNLKFSDVLYSLVRDRQILPQDSAMLDTILATRAQVEHQNMVNRIEALVPGRGISQEYEREVQRLAQDGDTVAGGGTAQPRSYLSILENLRDPRIAEQVDLIIARLAAGDSTQATAARNTLIRIFRAYDAALTANHLPADAIQGAEQRLNALFAEAESFVTTGARNPRQVAALRADINRVFYGAEGSRQPFMTQYGNVLAEILRGHYNANPEMRSLLVTHVMLPRELREFRTLEEMAAAMGRNTWRARMRDRIANFTSNSWDLKITWGLTRGVATAVRALPVVSVGLAFWAYYNANFYGIPVLQQIPTRPTVAARTSAQASEMARNVAMDSTIRASPVLIALSTERALGNNRAAFVDRQNVVPEHRGWAYWIATNDIFQSLASTVNKTPEQITADRRLLNDFVFMLRRYMRGEGLGPAGSNDARAGRAFEALVSARGYALASGTRAGGERTTTLQILQRFERELRQAVDRGNRERERELDALRNQRWAQRILRGIARDDKPAWDPVLRRLNELQSQLSPTIFESLSKKVADDVHDGGNPQSAFVIIDDPANRRTTVQSRPTRGGARRNGGGGAGGMQ